MPHSEAQRGRFLRAVRLRHFSVPFIGQHLGTPRKPQTEPPVPGLHEATPHPWPCLGEDLKGSLVGKEMQLGPRQASLISLPCSGTWDKSLGL